MQLNRKRKIIPISKITGKDDLVKRIARIHELKQINNNKQTQLEIMMGLQDAREFMRGFNEKAKKEYYEKIAKEKQAEALKKIEIVLRKLGIVDNIRLPVKQIELEIERMMHNPYENTSNKGKYRMVADEIYMNRNNLDEMNKIIKRELSSRPISLGAARQIKNIIGKKDKKIETFLRITQEVIKMDPSKINKKVEKCLKNLEQAVHAFNTPYNSEEQLFIRFFNLKANLEALSNSFEEEEQRKNVGRKSKRT